MFYVAAVMAFAPALVLMYVLLRPYTYPKSDYAYFSDPSFFILFSVGLIAGVIMFLVYTYVMNSVITVIVYAIVQVMVIVVCMNLKRYRGKSDSIFYGFGFGLGIGATSGTGFIYYLSTMSSKLGADMGLLDYTFLFVMALSMVFQFSALGTTVGDGIARHEPMQYAIQAMIYNFVYWIVFTLALYNDDALYIYLSAAMCLVISVFYLMYAYRKEIGTMVADVQRMNKKGKKI